MNVFQIECLEYLTSRFTCKTVGFPYLGELFCNADLLHASRL